MKDFLCGLNIYAVTLDAFLVILILCNVIKFARIGFVSSLFSLLLAVASYFLILPIGNFVSKKIYSAYFRNFFIKIIEDKLIKNRITDINFLKTILDFYPSNNQPMYFNKYIGDTDKLDSINSFAGLFSDKVIYPILNVLICLVTLILISFVFKMVNKLFTKLFKCFSYIPVLGKLNVFLGCIFGFLKSIVVIGFISLIIDSVILVSADQWQWLNSDVKSETYILKKCDEFAESFKIVDFLNSIEHKIFN